MTWSNLTRRKDLVERGAVGQIALHEHKRLGQRLDVAEVALLELRVVEGIEVVKRPDGVAAWSNRSQTCEPIKPAPPVTRKFMHRKLTTAAGGVSSVRVSHIF